MVDRISTFWAPEFDLLYSLLFSPRNPMSSSDAIVFSMPTTHIHVEQSKAAPHPQVWAPHRSLGNQGDITPFHADCRWMTGPISPSLRKVMRCFYEWRTWPACYHFIRILTPGLMRLVVKSSAGSEHAVNGAVNVSVNNAFWPVSFLPLWGKIKLAQLLSLVVLSFSLLMREYLSLVLNSFPPCVQMSMSFLSLFTKLFIHSLNRKGIWVQCVMGSWSWVKD